MKPISDLSLFEHQGSRTMERTATSLIACSGAQTDSSILSVPEHLLKSELLSCRYLGTSRLRNHYFQSIPERFTSGAAAEHTSRRPAISVFCTRIATTICCISPEPNAEKPV